MQHPDGGGSATSGVQEDDAAWHPGGRVRKEGFAGHHAKP